MESGFEELEESKLRDEFAKFAMQGLLIKGRWLEDEKSLSIRAYITANEMLKERKKHV